MKTLLVLLALIGLIGCMPRVTSGEIIKKWYEPENTYTTVDLISMGEGVLMPITQTHTDDEDYMITIFNGDLTSDHAVSKGLYDRLKVGQFINFQE